MFERGAPGAALDPPVTASKGRLLQPQPIPPRGSDSGSQGTKKNNMAFYMDPTRECYKDFKESCIRILRDFITILRELIRTLRDP